MKNIRRIAWIFCYLRWAVRSFWVWRVSSSDLRSDKRKVEVMGFEERGWFWNNKSDFWNEGHMIPGEMFDLGLDWNNGVNGTEWRDRVIWIRFLLNEFGKVMLHFYHTNKDKILLCYIIIILLFIMFFV